MVCKNRKDLPKEFYRDNMAKSDCQFFSQENHNYMNIVWKDKKQIQILTTIHNTNLINKKSRSGGEIKIKPIVFEHYNMNMHGVDLNNQ